MSATIDHTELFNAAIGCSAVAAAVELSLLDALVDGDDVDLAAFAAEQRCHLGSLTAIVKVLAHYDIVTWDDDRRVRGGSAFAETYRAKGFFLWLMRGYGHLLTHLGDASQLEHRVGNFIGRHGPSIARGSHDAGRSFVDPMFRRVVDTIDFRKAADLGCGAAERLVALARERSGFSGVGIDIDSNTVACTSEALAASGLGDRITVLVGDVVQLQRHPMLDDIELVFCFFMGHDLWPRERCIASLRRIRDAFPSATDFLLCDTYRSDLAAEDRPPIFTLGFELVHAAMGQYIPDVAEWETVFAPGGWQCVARHDVGVPYSTLFHLRPIKR